MNEREEGRRITDKVVVVFSLPNVSTKACDNDGLLTWVDGVLRIVVTVWISLLCKRLHAFCSQAVCASNGRLMNRRAIVATTSRSCLSPSTFQHCTHFATTSTITGRILATLGYDSSLRCVSSLIETKFSTTGRRHQLPSTVLPWRREDAP